MATASHPVIFLPQFLCLLLVRLLLALRQFAPHFAEFLCAVADGQTRILLLDAGTVLTAEHEERRPATQHRVRLVLNEPRIPHRVPKNTTGTKGQEVRSLVAVGHVHRDSDLCPGQSQGRSCFAFCAFAAAPEGLSLTETSTPKIICHLILQSQPESLFWSQTYGGLLGALGSFLLRPLFPKPFGGT